VTQVELQFPALRDYRVSPSQTYLKADQVAAVFEPELELTQTYMAQKPLLWAKVYTIFDVEIERNKSRDPKGKLVIRGPTHITQTDAWVSRGDSLNLFQKTLEKGDW